jgi:TRAP-type transport system periplasmic protein
LNQIAKIALSTTAVSTSGQAGKIWNLSYVHTNTPSDDYTLYGHIPFARSIEIAVCGRIQITLYGSETRIKNDQILDHVKSGKSDIGLIYTGLYPGKFSYIEVSALPYLYPNSRVGSRVTWQLFTQHPGIQSQFKDVKVLAIWITEPYIIAGRNRFYKTPDDFKGQRVRAGSGPPSDFVKALGGIPVLVTRTEVNQAFKNNTIDAALLPAESCLAFNTCEVAPFITWVSTVSTVNALVMNLNLWKSFPKDIQQSIMNVSGETASVHFGREVFDKSRQDMKCTIKKSGGKIHEYTPPWDEIQRWIEKSGQPVWNSWVQNQTMTGLVNAQQILDDALDRSREYSQE